MAYLVLARKYRPQTFDEIVGQEHVTQTLTNAIAPGRVHHAFLFTGARGVGKTTAARILAKCLSLRQRADGHAVQRLRRLPRDHRRALASTSGDRRRLEQRRRQHPRAARGHPLRAGARQEERSTSSTRCTCCRGGAWNALLKTLEEPPPHAVFVFATTEPHKLPATILSRCQRYDFKLVPQRRIAEHLTRS